MHRPPDPPEVLIVDDDRTLVEIGRGRAFLTKSFDSSRLVAAAAELVGPTAAG